MKGRKRSTKSAWGKELVNYAWDQAKVEAERYLDRQKKAIYEQRMGWMEEGAINNLQLNSAALYDKYVIQKA